MADTQVVNALERIVIAGVAMTNASLGRARPGLDLTFPQWRVLVILGDRPDGLAVGEIAQRIAVTLPATGRQLHRLSERGLLTLEPDERDRRVTRVRLTDAGHAARASIMGDRRQRIAEGVAGISLDTDVAAGLEHLADAMEAAAAATIPKGPGNAEQAHQLEIAATEAVGASALPLPAVLRAPRA